MSPSFTPTSYSQPLHRSYGRTMVLRRQSIQCRGWEEPYRYFPSSPMNIWTGRDLLSNRWRCSGFSCAVCQAGDAVARVLAMDDANLPALMFHTVEGLTQAGQVPNQFRGIWSFSGSWRNFHVVGWWSGLAVFDSEVIVPRKMIFYKALHFPNNRDMVHLHS